MAYGFKVDSLPALLVPWNNDVALDTIPDEAREQYEAMREANRIAAQARSNFEAIIQAGNPLPNSHVVFNYRFGKLAMAVAKGSPEAAKEKPVKAGKSLNDFYAQAQAAGRRV